MARLRFAIPSLASLAIAITFAGLSACEGRPRRSPSSSDPALAPRSGPTLAVLDLTAGAPEQQQPGILDVSPSRKQSFFDLAREVEHLGKDQTVRAVLVKIGSGSLGLARAMELGAALESLRASKPVFCHADGYSNAMLYAAARGCSKIYVSPAGELETVGLAMQLIYMHRLLAENLGISIDFLQIGKFKGAEEPFTRDGPSDEARASLEGTLADMRESWLSGVQKARPDAPEDAAEDGPYSPNAAKAANLIDEVGYLDDARDAAKKASGAVREEVRFGASAASSASSLTDLVRSLAGDASSSSPVALVRATGEITMGGGGRSPLGASDGITEHDMVRTLAKIEYDDDIKVLVMRIDSPGGSALASDLIWHALMRVRAKKPIVVSVGEMAASGGYYLASTGTTIYADEASIVGSIGVVGGKVAVDKALEKIGVHAETFPAKAGDAKAASRAAYLSPLASWDDDTRDKVRESMLGIYELFLSRVVEGRAGKLPMERLVESAEGRIFSGREGQARGLIDVLGGLMTAIAKARELAKLPADARVVVVGQKQGFLESALGAGGDDSGGDARAGALAGVTRGPRPMDLIEQWMPDAAPFVASMAPVLEGEHMLVAVPFAVIVR